MADPNAEHDICACPGISDKMINKVLDEDAAKNRASMTPAQIAQEKTDLCLCLECQKPNLCEWAVNNSTKRRSVVCMIAVRATTTDE